MSASTLLAEKLNRRFQENFQKHPKIAPNIVSSGFVQTWTSANIKSLNSSDSNQINYGPTVSAANINGSNYVINSVSTSHINNGLLSSNSNNITYRGSAGLIYQKPTLNLRNNQNPNESQNNGRNYTNGISSGQSSNTNNIHLTLPSNVNNLTLKNNNASQSLNENSQLNQFIDPINDAESVSDGEYIKSSIENNKKLIENLM